MNKQQLKGSAKEAAGKVQKNVGKATGNGTQAVKGTARELAGKAEKAIGNVKSDLSTRSGAGKRRDQDNERGVR